MQEKTINDQPILSTPAASILGSAGTGASNSPWEANEEIMRPRREGDFDLVNGVRDALIRFGLSDQVAAHFDTSQHVISSKDSAPLKQLAAMKVYWNLQLGMVPKSYEERSLINNIDDIQVWFRVFCERIIHFIVDNKLPAKLEFRHF